MLDQELFEIAAKLQNVRPDQLRLKRRYLDVIVVEKMDGAKFTYFVADLEVMAEGGEREAVQASVERDPAPEASAKPQHTRKR